MSAATNFERRLGALLLRNLFELARRARRGQPAPWLAGMLLLLSLLGPAAALAPPTAAKKPVYPVRSSSVRFWAFDLSCGAGALSSPVREEHPRDAAEFAVWGEAKFARVCTWSPRWLLLSALGIITRELASRQVREYLVPATLTPVAQPKAKAVSVALRQSLDTKVTKVLSGGNFRELGSVSGIVDRVVQAPGSGEGSC